MTRGDFEDADATALFGAMLERGVSMDVLRCRALEEASGMIRARLSCDGTI